MNKIDVIPPSRWSEAIALLVSPSADDLRMAQLWTIRDTLAADPSQTAGLLGHFRGSALTAACWLQQQPGRTATLWPPASVADHDPLVDAALVERALELARAQDMALVQTLLLTDTGHDAQTLRKAGFAHDADVLYLVCLAGQFPDACPTSRLEYASLPAADLSRLGQIVERSYEGTQDCPALNGVRAIDDVLAGYRAVGRFREDLWLIARAADGDVGCLLLADHPAEHVWELVYMGVLPKFRGRGMGLEITRYAQWQAGRENVERIVLAVDAANEPALAIYAEAGFVAWDRRSVFVRRMQR